MSEYKMDSEKFYSHIRHIYDVFGDSSSNTFSCFNPLDAFALIRGKFIQDNDDSQQVKTSRIHEYILGYDFADSIIFFSPKTIYFVVAAKKKMMIESMNKPEGINVPEIKIILRATADDNTPKIKKILEDIIKESNKPKINLGYFYTMIFMEKITDVKYMIQKREKNIFRYYPLFLISGNVV